MRFAEQQAQCSVVGVILQDHADIKKHLKTEQRGQNVKFFPCHAFSVSGSSIAIRAFDAIFFMLWVFCVLIIKRPRKVYVSTDPPVLVPFIVMIYSRVFGAKYIYHLQDIHPEAANVVIPVNRWLFRFLRWLDCLTMRNAHLLITITSEMAEEIKHRSKTNTRIEVLANPSVSFENVLMPSQKIQGFTFCGNAGRLQRIPLIIQAISHYIEKGGSLPFVFAGAGVFAPELKKLAKKYDNVSYLGLISASDAAQLNSEYEWALLPIEDEVTRYAFPSKSSSYVFAGAKILAICGEHTSVATWVISNRLGRLVNPEVSAISAFFQSVEANTQENSVLDLERNDLKQRLSFDVFISKLTNLIAPEGVI